MKNKIINSILSQGLFIVVSGLISIVMVPILIKMLGKIEYGAFELISSLMIITFLLEFGMGSTLVKFIPNHKENINNLKSFIWSYFYLKLSITLIGCLAVIFIGYNFDTFFNLRDVENIASLKIAVYLFALGILFSTISTFLENILKGFVHFELVNLGKILSIIQFFIIFYIYYIAFENHTIITIALLWFTTRPLVATLNTLFILKYVKLLHLLVPVKFEYKYIKETLHFLFGMSYITIVAQLYNNLPKIILGIFATPIAVGYWGIMDRIKKPLLDIQGAMLRPLIPILSDKKYSNLSESTIFQASRMNYAIMSFLGIITIVNIDNIILLWVGQEFIEVAKLIKTLLLPFIFPNAGIFLMMYYSQGKTKINSIFLTVNTTVSITLATILLIVYKDISYFVYAYTYTLIILNVIQVTIYINHYKLNTIQYIKSVILPLSFTIISTLILSNYMKELYNPNLWGLVASITITSFCFLILFFIFIPKEDKEVLFQLLRKLKR